ncbi:CxxH/CxxC protein [Bacillus canaveralius]|uniref:CxxH/CxxC protein n=1 Tax=Bacillus canaveralius TaxID=1403243 RepID=A0A2N5GGV1_9BACI|nr:MULTISPECIES: CxxH/CxxC protein [Bacillus]PLR79994.1 CxxH/CxxC protein [Bacillus canaveralius]PLR85741.1 CxxH/CxxC protein [Bacillus sp. V33-4]PLR91121.1 CxxH/CxxC protein [Bacillus canaveralius]RSK52156.1 CxxH/CxxC protein [Bacillus canaveralius]
MIYCCEEHVELALDVAVDEYETAPKFEKISDEQSLLTTCGYCEKPAVYMVANE